jgi:hypothetical protein
MIKFKQLKSIYLYTLYKLIYKFCLDSTNDDDDALEVRPKHTICTKLQFNSRSHDFI